MWRFILVPTLFLTASCCTMPQTYGKSEGQILAMGRDRWLEFHALRAGDREPESHGVTTDSMVSGINLYAAAASHRNDRLCARKKHADVWKKLHSLLREYSSCLNEIMSEWSGNDTGVEARHGRASYWMNAEDEFTEILRGRPRKVKPIAYSAVREQLVIGSHQELWEPQMKKAPNVFRSWKKAYASIAALTRKLPKQDAYRVLHFCYRNTNITGI